MYKRKFFRGIVLEKQLITYAIINVNESHNIDQFDHFVTFAKEALLRSGVETISANELRDKIEEYFKISLPIGVLNTMLKRKLLPNGYVKKDKQILIPNYEKLHDSNFQEIKNRIMEKHDRLIEDIINFGEQNYNLKVNYDEVEETFETFLDKNQLVLLNSSLNPSPDTQMLQTKSNKNDALEYVISKFIENANNSSSLSFNYIIDIVKGTMITNALYYKEDFSTIDMKFKGTEVYFDSTFLIFALGYSGEAQQEPCLELINMLRSDGAILRVFRHNVEEIIGILEFCKINLTTGIYDPHGTIPNFLDKGYTDIDIDRLIYGIEDELRDRFQIRVVESVGYDDYSHVISHKDLEDKLKQNILYRREEARERDVESVSAIFRLRKGKKSRHIEKSRAIFVTNNFKYTSVVNQYYYKLGNRNTIPPVIHDSTLTNIMWLKHSSKVPDLPRKRIIAQTFAATQPREHLWNRYLETIEKYRDDFTEKDFVFLNYSRNAKELLMDITMGDEEIISIGTLNEILSERDRREQYKIEKIRQREEEQRRALQKELNSALEQQAATNELIENRTTTIAKKKAILITNSLFGVVAMIIGFIVYISYFEWIRSNNPIIHYIIILLITLLTLMGAFGKTFIPLKKKIKMKLQKKIESNIRDTYYTDKDN